MIARKLLNWNRTIYLISEPLLLSLSRHDYFDFGDFVQRERVKIQVSEVMTLILKDTVCCDSHDLSRPLEGSADASFLPQVNLFNNMCWFSALFGKSRLAGWIRTLHQVRSKFALPASNHHNFPT